MGLGEELAKVHILNLINIVSADTAENAKVIEHAIGHLDEEPDIPGFNVEKIRSAGAHLCDALEDFIDCVKMEEWSDDAMSPEEAAELSEQGKEGVRELRRRLSGISS